MGLYDTINCEYPLPNWPEGLEEGSFQSKDTPAQGLMLYRITSDGKLQVRNFDSRIIPAKLSGDPPSDATWSDRLNYYDTTEHYNHRWVDESFSGAIRFYTSYKDAEFSDYDVSGWVEYQAVFVDGKLHNINLAKHTEPRNYSEEEKAAHEKSRQYYAKLRQERLEKSLSSIEDVKKQISNLAEIQDSLFADLLVKINVSENSDLKDWIFDYVFNDVEHSLEYIKENL